MHLGRTSFAAMAGDTKGLIELDNSAVAKLSGNALGAAGRGRVDERRADIEEAATRLYQAGCATPLPDDGRWLLLLSALDLD